MLLIATATLLLLIVSAHQMAALAGGRGSLPRFFWSTAWGFMFLFALLFGGVFAIMNRMTLFVMVGVACFLAGCWLTETITARPIRGAAAVQYQRQIAWLRPFIWATTLVGMLSPIYFARQLGFHPSELVDMSSYFSAVRDANAAIRNYDVEQNLLSKICGIFPLGGATVAGMVIGLGRRRFNITLWECLLPVLPGFLLSAVTSVRGGTIVPIVIMFGGLATGLVMRRREGVLFSRRAISWTAGVVVALVALILFMQTIRAGNRASNFSAIVEHMRPWIAGYLPGISVWAEEQWDGTMSYGVMTFRGIASLLGASGNGVDTFLNDTDIGNGQVTNAMTFYRFAIQDFGMAGSLLFTFVWGAISGWLGTLVRRGNFAAAPFYAINIAAVIWSPNAWFLGYGTRIFAPIVACAFLVVAVRQRAPLAMKRRAIQARRTAAMAGRSV
ncbi:O-antigen polymerase [Sphingomonas oryzagri]|uniref:O-antigen polymerase n=1 Tax=Sphingomonas oryzagri TaxID=3042314 RepID=A0ABT6MWA3_9SPHN|nr:O-antigen polymerase [Sphingomonas oryzagri]MDH7637267.1 O-antigen polymerase [Sphingomonas oryzagri]